MRVPLLCDSSPSDSGTAYSKHRFFLLASHSWANTNAAPAPASKTSGFNFVSQDVLDETFNEQQKKSKVKVKDDITKKLPKVANPGKWDSEVTAGMQACYLYYTYCR